MRGKKSIGLWQGEKVFPIRQSVLKEMVNHCFRNRPYEACGLLSGKNGQVNILWKMNNVLRSPTAFEMDAAQLCQTFKRIRARGEKLIGIYHSHPTGPPYPSATDIANAHYPEVVYVIVSLAKSKPEVGCYRILNKREIIPLTLAIQAV